MRAGSFLPIAAILLLMTGCAAREPVLYPDSRLQDVGPARAQQDVEQCKALAGQYVAGHPGKEVARETGWGAAAGAAVGTVGGAIVGDVGRGAALGAATGATAGLMRGAYRAAEGDPLWRNFVEQCLHDRGYRVLGWQ